MQIFVNDTATAISEKTNLKFFLESLNINLNHIVIEYNQNILSQDDWPNTHLKDNDKINIVSFVGGG